LSVRGEESVVVKVLRSLVRGPLEPHTNGLAEQLLRRGYTRSSAEQHVCFLAHLDRWMSAEGIGLDGLSVIHRLRALLRAGTQAVLYHHDAPVLMAIAKVSLGWPLTVVAVALTLAAVRKAVRSDQTGAATGY
jgi:hypothetical protein